MDKWKVVVILALIFGLGGYGWYSSNAGSAGPNPQPTPPTGPTPAPTPDPASMVGKPLIAWDMPATLWVNTPKPVNIADLKGSVALIEFFRIGCSHCQEAAPFMEEVYKKYGARGMKMVAIQSPSKGDPAENDWNAVKGKVKEWGLTYPVTFDEGGSLFQGKYKLHTFPTMIVVDKAGVVRYFKSGHTPESAKALTDYLDSVLKP